MLKRFQKLKRVLIMKQMLREMKNKDKKERLPVWRSLFGFILSTCVVRYFSVKIDFDHIVIVC